MKKQDKYKRKTNKKKLKQDKQNKQTMKLIQDKQKTNNETNTRQI